MASLDFDKNQYIRLDVYKSRGMKDISLLAQFEESVFELCIDDNQREEFKKRITQRLNKNLEPQKFESLKQKLANQILCDREELLKIIVIIQENSGSKIENQINEFKKMYEMDTLQSSAKFESILKNALKDIPNFKDKLSSTNFILQNISSSISNIDQTITASKNLQAESTDEMKNCINSSAL